MTPAQQITECIHRLNQGETRADLIADGMPPVVVDAAIAARSERAQKENEEMNNIRLELLLKQAKNGAEKERLQAAYDCGVGTGRALQKRHVEKALSAIGIALTCEGDQ